ncbi:cytochrome-c peroxidase [Methylolobus aquaticus]
MNAIKCAVTPSLSWPSIVLSAGLACATAVAAPLGLPEAVVPPDNPQNSAKIALGDKLFHDSRLSSNGAISCATCHQDTSAFTDSPLTVSKGVGGALGQRNAPTVLNAVYLSSQFWDGRAGTLEEQALQPLVNAVEMGLPSVDAALATIRVDPDYPARFREAFGPQTEPSARTLAQAIASYERTLIAGDSPFDRYQFAGDKTAMSPAAVRGLAVFTAWGRCVSCHTIEKTHATFTDNRFHNIGIGFNRYPEEIESLAAGMPPPRIAYREQTPPAPDRLASELGRFAVTREKDHLGAFRTPGLRNVALTAPYMHDGSLKTLREVVLHYVRGGFSPGDRARNKHMDRTINFLELSNAQVDDLVEFLKALTSPGVQGTPTEH